MILATSNRTKRTAGNDNLCCILTIDPGQSGGVGVYVAGVAGVRPMPATGGDLLGLLRGIKIAADKSGMETVCVLELVGGNNNQDLPGSRMFRFRENYKFIKVLVQVLGIKLVLVRPKVWQKFFGLGTAAQCACKSEFKNKLKAEAQRRFPNLHVTHKTANALLILEWATRTAIHKRAGGHGVTSQKTSGTKP